MSIKRAHIALDTLYVFDTGQARVQIGPVDGTPTRAIPFQAVDVLEVVRLSDSMFAVAAVIPSREQAGLPVHTLHRQAGLLKSFGDTRPVMRLDASWLNARTIAAAQGDRVWVARQNAYEIERWTLAGARDLVLRRSVPWFQPWTERGAPGTIPTPWLIAIHELAADYLAILVQVPAADFARRLGPAVTRNNRTEYDYSRSKLLFDTIIKIIHVPTATVMHSQRIDDSLIGPVAGSSRPFSVDVHAADTVDDIPIIHIVTLTFVPSSN